MWPAVICLCLLVSACVYAPGTSPGSAADPGTRLQPPQQNFMAISATLPDPASGGSGALFDSLNEGVPLLLDLTLQPPLAPSIRQPDGTYKVPDGCDFGVVEAAAISLPTGSNHLLIDAELGERSRHPANLLSCEYDPGQMTEGSPGSVWRLRGCFLPRTISVPTAVVWALNPMNAGACGIGN